MVKSHKEHHLARKNNFGRAGEMAKQLRMVVPLVQALRRQGQLGFYEIEASLVYLHRKFQANQGYIMTSALETESACCS